jgi:hypothetical protein
MAGLYPHRQTIIIAVVCAIAVVGVIAYVHWQTLSIQANQPDIVATTVGSNPLNGGDAIGNGTIASSSGDWKKQFYGTATGTTLVLGGDNNQTASSGPLTLTDLLSRDFFARYIQLQQTGQDSNTQLVQDTIDQTIANASASASQPKIYAIGSITVSNKTDSVSVRTYGDAVANILSSYMPRDNVADMANQAFDQGNMDLLNDLDPVISAYQDVIGKLLAVPVPQPIAQYHLDLVNGISSILFTAQGLRNIQTDPLQAMVTLSSYSSSQDKMQTALLNMKNYFNIAGISFTAAEPGILFSTIVPISQ